MATTSASDWRCTQVRYWFCASLIRTWSADGAETPSGGAVTVKADRMPEPAMPGLQAAR